MTNLFIPLKREYFEAFANGSKKHESEIMDDCGIMCELIKL